MCLPLLNSFFFCKNTVSYVTEAFAATSCVYTPIIEACRNEYVIALFSRLNTECAYLRRQTV